jgi:ferric-dicitrate binding protein FerR (iron transport regulator)
MSGARNDREPLDRLLALAARAAPPALAPTDARRMARRALLAGIARRHAASERSGFWFALGGLTAALLVAIGLRLASDVGRAGHVAGVQPRPAPLRMQLPSRDTLIATPGAQFELVGADPRDRRIELRGGAIAFDVARLDAGQRFTVVTPHVTVRVRGTVFSVAALAQRTEVRVYEGAVAVAAASGERVLRGGESYASDGSRVTQDPAAPLQHEAAAIAAQRVRTPSRAPAPPARPAVPEPEPEPRRDASAAPRVVRARAIAVDAGDSLQRARGWLHDGQPERALAAALRVHASSPVRNGEWLVLQADALRSLGRAREAALAYRDAALLLPADARVRAGFKAADVMLHELDDPRAALAVLYVADVDAEGSALRERALLLRIEALQRLGEPITEVAERYLAAYPDSAGAPRLRALLEAAR